MFENYLYVSGTSKVLKKHFIDYAKKMISVFKLNKKSKILDIACNDGTFLEYFKNKKFKNVVGVEPAKNLRVLNLKKGIDINTNFFGKKFSDKMKDNYESFDLITANNVFAHSPHLYDFSQGVKNLLSDKGVFVFEVSYLPTVLKKKTFAFEPKGSRVQFCLTASNTAMSMRLLPLNFVLGKLDIYLFYCRICVITLVFEGDEEGEKNIKTNCSLLGFFFQNTYLFL